MTLSGFAPHGLSGENALSPLLPPQTGCGSRVGKPPRSKVVLTGDDRWGYNPSNRRTER